MSPLEDLAGLARRCRDRRSRRRGSRRSARLVPRDVLHIATPSSSSPRARAREPCPADRRAESGGCQEVQAQSHLRKGHGRKIARMILTRSMMETLPDSRRSATELRVSPAMIAMPHADPDRQAGTSALLSRQGRILPATIRSKYRSDSHANEDFPMTTRVGYIGLEHGRRDGRQSRAQGFDACVYDLNPVVVRSPTAERPPARAATRSARTPRSSRSAFRPTPTSRPCCWAKTAPSRPWPKAPSS